MLRYTLCIVLMLFCSVSWGQQTNRPQEYIESSSPLPGGGVVTSIVYPGQDNSPLRGQMPVLTIQEASTRSANLRPQSVLASPANKPAQTQLSSAQFPASLTAATTVVVPTPRVPTLGVPTRWNASLLPSCTTCKPQSAAVAPLGPVNLTGISPPAAMLPPALPRQTVQSNSVGNTRNAYVPLVQLRNMPPNVYAGQGIFGSPKLFVDGQPIRNLFRYIMIP